MLTIIKLQSTWKGYSDRSDEGIRRKGYVQKKEISISPLWRTDNFRLAVLNYECTFSNFLYSCEFGKRRWSNLLKQPLTYWTPENIYKIVA